MKILHAADLHLETPFSGRTDAQLAFLKKALLQVPGKIVELCKAHSCDLLLLSGDLFDGAASAESVQALKNALKEVGIPTFITPGNHDFCSPDSPYLTSLWPENVHIFTKPVMESAVLPSLDCRIYGAGYQSMDCGALLENFHAEGSETYQIGILHGDPIQKNAPYCPITQAQVAASGLRYLALGHVHKAGSFVAGDTLCGWPGCPMGRGYDETGEKGVYLATLESTATLEFLPLDTPRFYDLEAEALSAPREAAASLLPPVQTQDFYRITLTGECEAFDISALSFPQCPNLELRDKTQPPADLWVAVGNDSLEGVYFGMLKEAMEGQDEDSARIAMLAAKISRKILDGGEVVLP
jgi:DNA repair exonuclease SbcCD nuclease subunit